MSQQRLFARLPPDWRALLMSCGVAPVETGMSTATLFRIRGPALDGYLKIALGAEAAELRDEIARTTWLAARGVRVPPLLRSFDGGRLVAAMMGALPGAHPQDCARPVWEVVDILANAVRTLHALPVVDCPFDETIATRLARARRFIDQGMIEPEHFAERNAGLTPQQIYDRLIAQAPPSEDIVLVHGDARFDNLLIDAAGAVAFVDCGHCGRGDRYLDLVGLSEDIDEHFGAEWVAPFLLACGETDWDSGKARFFSDLYELF